MRTQGVFTRSFGYTVNDETLARTWRIHTNLQEVITIPELRCLPTLEYNVDNSNTVDEYWPIRIMIRGINVFMTFSHVAFSGEGSEAKPFFAMLFLKYKIVCVPTSYFLNL